jgi:hypothetical protein
VFYPKQVIYFKEFFFKNGNPSKPKYLIILGKLEGETIVASLPTRTNNAPALVDILHGCINLEERCYNCYIFEPNRPICENGFSFYLPTFIYGNQVEDYKIENLETIYKIEGVDYEEQGILTEKEYQAILECILKSSSTKRKIKKLLQSQQRNK